MDVEISSKSISNIICIYFARCYEEEHTIYIWHIKWFLFKRHEYRSADMYYTLQCAYMCIRTFTPKCSRWIDDILQLISMQDLWSLSKAFFRLNDIHPQEVILQHPQLAILFSESLASSVAFNRWHSHIPFSLLHRYILVFGVHLTQR